MFEFSTPTFGLLTQGKEIKFGGYYHEVLMIGIILERSHLIQCCTVSNYLNREC